MDVQKLTATLHRLERKVLPHLEKASSLQQLVKDTGLKQVEVMRALQWLENKGLVVLTTQTRRIIELSSNGRKYLRAGLPEKRFLQAAKQKKQTLDQIKRGADLERDELNVCIGLLKSKAAINFEGKKIAITSQGKRLLQKPSLEEKFLHKLSSQSPALSELSDEERHAYDSLKKRKGLIHTATRKQVTAQLTELGGKVLKSGIKSANVVDALTPEMLRTGNWKQAKFRSYDVKINVPSISGGMKHPSRQAEEHARRIWVEMGFKEMTGNLVQTSFWNFDALFTAQDHPVRDLQDTFYLKQPAKGTLPRKLLTKVKQAHEKGIKGSIGWQYKWNPEDAKLNVLRTHTTCLSAQTIAALKKEQLPAKFFSVGKNFRNETLDWHHLFELIQVEGIVVDENANLRHLIGYLKEFFKKMGYPDVRVRPAYFPYTEPSCEVDVLHPVRKQWMELGGAGIFRPEMVVPLLGKDIPVLAWGLGLERSIMEYYNITDIRNIYRNDLKQLREVKAWLG